VWARWSQGGKRSRRFCRAIPLGGEIRASAQSLPRVRYLSSADSSGPEVPSQEFEEGVAEEERVDSEIIGRSRDGVDVDVDDEFLGSDRACGCERGLFFGCCRRV
jgi:hypothetical protein